MKVAFIGDRLGLATGGNWYVARVAEELAAMGVEVTLITLIPPQDLPWSPGVKIISRTMDFSFGRRPGKGGFIPFFYSRLAAVTALKDLVKESYDILYSVGGPSNLVNHLCRKTPYRPNASVAVIHHLFRQGSWLKFFLSAETYRKPFQTVYHLLGDRLAKEFYVVTVSDYWRKKLIQRGFPAKRMTVIPNGADWREWPFFPAEEAKARLGLAGRLVVYTSPLRLNKGIMLLLEALRQLAARFPSLMVLATGVTDDRTRRRVDQFLDRNALRDRFRYDGLVPRAQLPVYYHAADIVALPSLEEEGWGVTLLEGMISGRPVICSPLGAMPELVNGRGIVLAENRPSCLAQALQTLLTDPELGKQLGQAGQQHARGFTFQAAALAHRQWFEKILRDQER